MRQGCASISPEMKACAYSGHIRCQEDKLEETNPGLLFDLEDCSTQKQAVHRMAWVIRFCHNARHSRDERHSGALNPDERKAALNLLIRAVQGLTYCRDMVALQNGSPLPPDSTLQKMRPQLDADEILCAVPRTNESPIIILPERSRLTVLIIEEAHRLVFHQGVRITLAQVSVHYLVRRRTVKGVVDACRRCRRFKGLPYRSAEAALPPFRTEFSRPFTKTGVDYFGPLYIDSG